MNDVGSPFRVLIAGGSVSGLVLANALERAGIDYLVLEKGEIAPNLGASISILCHTARVLEQLGIWQTILSKTLPLLDRLHFDENGDLFEDTAVLRLLAERTGRPIVFIARQVYLQTLLENIPQSSRCKIQDHKKVEAFHEDDEGVTVVTDKGERIRGSILIGADGVHSNVRDLMANYFAKSNPPRAENFRPGFVASYRTIFVTSRNTRRDGTPFMSDGMVHNVYYRNVSGVAASGVDGLVFWFLYVKEESPSTMPNCPRYSEEDAEATIERYGHLKLGPDYTFFDLWEAREKAAMVPLEEGVLDGSWNSGGRVVLIGDSVAKATVNPGLGGNTLVEAVCHLLNELQPLLQQCPGRQPTTAEIQAVFQKYEAVQKPRAQSVVRLSGYITRFEAMETWYWRLARVISPWIPDSLKAKAFLDFVSEAPILNFLPDPDKNRL